MGLLIFHLLLAVLFSFLCSILEAVLLSITPSYVQSLNEKNPKVSKQLQELKANIDQPLAAILSLNTIAHTIGAAGVGAQAAIVFEEVSVGVISAILTIIILIFSEIIPKTIGARYWRSLAPFAARVLKLLVFILYPFVLLSKFITRLIASKKKGAEVSREEFSAMADIGRREGVFQESEMRVIKNLIAFKDILVQDIMTPRTVVVGISENTPLKEVYADKNYLRFSRLLIYKNNLDNVSGYVHKHDVLQKLAEDRQEILVKEIYRKLLVISEDVTIPKLFERMMETREHIALAVDEYGGTAGVVTLEDILETLLGVEIVDEFDNTQDMQSYARDKWKVRAAKLGLLSKEEVIKVDKQDKNNKSR
jgi:CBS domain containing-hemolysin-like protein